METLIKWVTERPKTLLALIAGITALSIIALINPGIKVDPNPYMLDESHSSMQAYRQLKSDYSGTLESALIMLVHPKSLYNTRSLERITKLTTALENMSLMTPEDETPLTDLLPRLEGDTRELVQSILAGGITREDESALQDVQLALEMEPNPALSYALDEVFLRLYPIRKVTSLANLENITTKDDELVVGKLYQNVPRTPEELKSVVDSIESNEIFQDTLISKDGRATVMTLENYIPIERADLVLRMVSGVNKLLESIPGEETAHIAGTPVMSAYGNNNMKKDNAKLFPFVVGLVLALLFLTFRNFNGVFLPLGVVIISVLLTLAAKVFFNIPLNTVTTTLPVFLITIGVADGIHMVSEFKDHFRRLGDRAMAVRATMEKMIAPVVMTSVTTAVGFASLAFTDIRYIRHFGLFVAVGVIAAMVISLLLIPAVLRLGKNRPPQESTASTASKKRFAGSLKFDAFILNLLTRVSLFSIHRYKLVLVAGLLITAVGLTGASKLRVENDFVTFFEKTHPIVLATNAVDTLMAGSNIANLLVSIKDAGPEPFKSPENLAAIVGLQKHLETLSFVGKTLSLADILKRTNLVMNDNDPAYNRLPHAQETVTGSNGEKSQVSGRDLIAQYLLLYENGGGENLTDFTDRQFDTLNVRVIMSTRNTTYMTQFQEEINKYAASNLPAGMQVRFAGSAELITTTNNVVVWGQVISLSLSFTFIFLLLLVQFRSLSKGLLGMIPLGFAVIFNFGMMGFSGIYLNLATAIISSVVIGIGVDFAIHYLSRLQGELKQYASLEKAIVASMTTSGKAISANAIIVAMGFLVLLLSTMVPMRQVGLMVAQTLLVSGVGTLVLLPAAITFFRPAFARVPEEAKNPAEALGQLAPEKA